VVFHGDGECDEPETLGCIPKASRKTCDIWWFVWWNLQPAAPGCSTRANGKIMAGNWKLVSAGAGWNVIKSGLGRMWTRLFEQDEDGHMQRAIGRKLG